MARGPFTQKSSAAGKEYLRSVGVDVSRLNSPVEITRQANAAYKRIHSGQGIGPNKAALRGHEATPEHPIKTIPHNRKKHRALQYETGPLFYVARNGGQRPLTPVEGDVILDPVDIGKDNPPHAFNGKNVREAVRRLGAKNSEEIRIAVLASYDYSFPVDWKAAVEVQAQLLQMIGDFTDPLTGGFYAREFGNTLFGEFIMPGEGGGRWRLVARFSFAKAEAQSGQPQGPAQGRRPRR